MNIASYIEHTNLSPTLDIHAIDRLVREAIDHHFLGICVPPFWVKRAYREIAGRPITLVTVAGFPLGYNMTETKLDEISRAIGNGAHEVDVVWNLTAFRTGLPWTKIELARCSQLAHDRGALLKVIIETALLSDADIVEACRMCSDAGADFVKTSTGFAGGGATPAHVALMRKHLPPSVGIKASGGIKTFAQASALIEAGANRIGTSSAVNIVQPSTSMANS